MEVGSLYSVPSNLIILSLPKVYSEYAVANLVFPTPVVPKVITIINII